MAKSSVLYLVLLAFLPNLAIAKSHHHYHHNHGIKSMQFTLYQHDFFNKTDFIIIKGVAGSNISLTTAPFGTISVLRDQLTATPNPSSKVVGMSEATSIASSFDGLDSLTIARITLDLEDGHKGTLSILGVVNTLKPSDSSVVSGTGDFLFVQGILSTTLVSMDGLSFVYKLDFHLFWPPYAAQAIKGYKFN